MLTLQRKQPKHRELQETAGAADGAGSQKEPEPLHAVEPNGPAEPPEQQPDPAQELGEAEIWLEPHSWLDGVPNASILLEEFHRRNSSTSSPELLDDCEEMAEDLCAAHLADEDCMPWYNFAALLRLRCALGEEEECDDGARISTALGPPCKCHHEPQAKIW